LKVIKVKGISEVDTHGNKHYAWQRKYYHIHLYLCLNYSPGILILHSFPIEAFQLQALPQFQILYIKPYKKVRKRGLIIPSILH